MVKRLLYLTNARLPTEKAHGFQICKMCEAFAHHGVSTLLLHPSRYQPDPALRQQSVFAYYGIAPIFPIHTLPNADILVLERHMPGLLFARLFWLHTLLWSYYAMLRARQVPADLYYTRQIEIAFWLVRAGLPTMCEAHAGLDREHQHLFRRIVQHPALQGMVVLTSFIQERFVRLGMPMEKTLVLPDSADLSMFRDLPDQAACRARLGLPPERLIIGYTGRFHTMGVQKGIPDLVQAMARVPVIGEQEPLLLCVGGPMHLVPGYQALAEQVGVPASRLRFVDRVAPTEVPTWIHACDIAVAPFPATEHYQYFMSPLKIFEYMAAGVPILATDLPSLREVLRHDVNAWLVPPDDPAALAAGIEVLARQTERRRRLAATALQDVQHATWQRRAAAILAYAGLDR